MKRISLKEAQSLELDALLFLDDFCKHNGLEYSLCGGTLLGAVRHEGFIPWDDDVDVFMSRPDYDRLAQLTYLSDSTQDLGQRYTFIGPGHGTYYPWIRLIDNRTSTELQFLDDSYGTPHLFIDIIPLDGVPNDKQEHDRHIMRLRAWRKLQLLYFSEPGTGKSTGKKVLKTIFVPILRLMVKPMTITGRIEQIARQYPYEASEKVRGTVISDFRQPSIRREQFDKKTYLSFEGHDFSTMSCWEEWLIGRFGDYMTPRPDYGRHYIGMWADESILGVSGTSDSSGAK